MKSIKEKAEENLRDNNTTQYEYRSYIEGAEFGANYVLEQIEFAKSLGSCAHVSLNAIEQCINQLKNQPIV